MRIEKVRMEEDMYFDDGTQWTCTGRMERGNKARQLLSISFIWRQIKNADGIIDSM